MPVVNGPIPLQLPTVESLESLDGLREKLEVLTFTPTSGEEAAGTAYGFIEKLEEALSKTGELNSEQLKGLVKPLIEAQKDNITQALEALQVHLSSSTEGTIELKSNIANKLQSIRNLLEPFSLPDLIGLLNRHIEPIRREEKLLRRLEEKFNALTNRMEGGAESIVNTTFQERLKKLQDALFEIGKDSSIQLKNSATSLIKDRAVEFLEVAQGQLLKLDVYDTFRERSIIVKICTLLKPFSPDLTSVLEQHKKKLFTPDITSLVDSRIRMEALNKAKESLERLSDKFQKCKDPKEKLDLAFQFFNEFEEIMKMIEPLIKEGKQDAICWCQDMLDQNREILNSVCTLIRAANPTLADRMVAEHEALTAEHEALTKERNRAVTAKPDATLFSTGPRPDLPKKTPLELIAEGEGSIPMGGIATLVIKEFNIFARNHFREDLFFDVSTTLYRLYSEEKKICKLTSDQDLAKLAFRKMHLIGEYTGGGDEVHMKITREPTRENPFPFQFPVRPRYEHLLKS